jgi:hypothetical protein
MVVVVVVLLLLMVILVWVYKENHSTTTHVLGLTQTHPLTFSSVPRL